MLAICHANAALETLRRGCGCPSYRKGHTGYGNRVPLRAPFSMNPHHPRRWVRCVVSDAKNYASIRCQMLSLLGTHHPPGDQISALPIRATTGGRRIRLWAVAGGKPVRRGGGDFPASRPTTTGVQVSQAQVVGVLHCGPAHPPVLGRTTPVNRAAGELRLGVAGRGWFRQKQRRSYVE